MVIFQLEIDFCLRNKKYSEEKKQGSLLVLFTGCCLHNITFNLTVLGAVTLDVRIGLYDDPPNKETVKMLEETCKFFPFLERFGRLWESLLLRFGLSSTTYREFCQTEDNAIKIGQKIVNQKVKELSVNNEEEFVENQGTSNVNITFH